MNRNNYKQSNFELVLDLISFCVMGRTLKLEKNVLLIPNHLALLKV